MSDNQEICAVILAAGKGTRMRNSKPKILHEFAGRSLISHVLAQVAMLNPSQTIVVLAPGMEEIQRAILKDYPNVCFAIQEEPLGTGHALKSALPVMDEFANVLVLLGDAPLLTASSMARLLDTREEGGHAVCVAGMQPPLRKGYGRLEIVQGMLRAIVEDELASEELKASAPCNSGLMAIDGKFISALLANLEPKGKKSEYFLTDIVSIALDKNRHCGWVEIPWQEGHGINSQAQLAEANSLWQERARQQYLEAGVIMTAPSTIEFAVDVKIAAGVVLEPNIVFGPGVDIQNGSIIKSFSYIEGATIGEHAVIGPFARLRPTTEIGSHCRIGNFVETKNLQLGDHAKSGHLSYLGDCNIGKNANIGAGTITCNYDGFSKWKTQIGDGAFIGSNSALVAPVEIGADVIVAAGSTITRSVDEGDLALTRVHQENKKGMGKALRERNRRKKIARSGDGNAIE